MERGELDLAERLFAEASAFFEEQRRFGDLAVCEQARSHLAGLRGDTAGAHDLATASLDRFERLGASVAAADSMLLGAQHAYERGDIEEMKRLAQEARDVYQARAIHERCAQVDLMLAGALEDNLNRTDHGRHETRSIDTALSLALPAALALAAARTTSSPPTRAPSGFNWRTGPCSWRSVSPCAARTRGSSSSWWNTGAQAPRWHWVQGRAPTTGMTGRRSSRTRA
nr:hypothetical protein [Streptomyces milbemycinicus]